MFTSGVSYLPTPHIESFDMPQFGRDWSNNSYPSWVNSPGNPLPITTSHIAEIFGRLKQRFGFQHDNMRNMFDHLMVQLDSRASRLGTDLALVTLHADYIGGENANYRRWYIASQMDIVDTGCWKDFDSFGNPKSDSSKSSVKDDPTVTTHSFKLAAVEQSWRLRMQNLTNKERITQVILYLLCWGEANQVRFMPECLCFIYKCALDYWEGFLVDPLGSIEDVKEGHYIDSIITPLYRYSRDQIYERVDDAFVHREKDHNKIVGYDDMNQLFWYREGLMRLALANKIKLLSIPKDRRYFSLKDVQWNKAFYKTYRENRTWLHIVVNFSRIWIAHLSIFWFYTAFNSPSLYTVGYEYMINNQPPSHVKWTVVALGGAVGPFINLLASVGELLFVPRKWPGVERLIWRFLFLLFLLVINIAPTVYIFLFTPLEDKSDIGLGLAIVHMVIALFTTLYLSFVPLGGLFGSYMNKLNNRRFLASKYFTAGFHSLSSNDRLVSCGLWICVFVAKLIESYVFLTLSLRDPIRELSIIDLPYCTGDLLIGAWLCQNQPKVVLGLILITDLVLFFLDTYLWYIIFNTVFSVSRSFYLGASIWSPWRNIFARLPKRIYTKIMHTRDRGGTRYKPKHYVAQVWNAIIISMFSEHLIPIEQMQNLIFRHEFGPDGTKALYEPPFFVSQEDQSFNSVLFESHSAAERRISFFAQSLATPIAGSYPIDAMPTFTVLIPHYSEKILLSLREIIREESTNSKVTLLEYLKQLHPVEWNCFVQDTKGTYQQDLMQDTAFEQDDAKEKVNDLPYYCVGFKSSDPEYTLRTRLWASLRSQTLYRTISGFMNYMRAIKLLYSVEQFSNLPRAAQVDSVYLDEELHAMATRKFHMVVAMQRLNKLSTEEYMDAEFLLHTYPDLKLAFLIEEPPAIPGEEPLFYSALIDGHCEILPNGQRQPKYKIRLSGNPILGDGKSDNQNHALIFYRGEYIQLVDANQDNYLEECIKIRSMLAEFEEINPPEYLYGHDARKNVQVENSSPVAILGAREYIFSENIGVLGDVAAGKEQTFGTLFARTLSKIGGKLHYGHPDFLNAIFMTTRGGVSKAQKGLHLNEDIYAGMTALLRGGRIKHCEYSQCGKGRDLGFGSILNFTTKIGAGMGEQMLSREYFYLGTQLPLDRFLSFYYAHPGFHINNMFIVVSLQLFLTTGINLAALIRDSVVCEYNRNSPITDLHRPLGCNNLVPVLEWVERCVLSIFVVFFISFLPLFVQELTERGFWRAATRLSKHFASLSPLFEVFVCQIYAQSLVHDLSIGGAKYISTGRGFATTRIPFCRLYVRFAQPSIYFGAVSMLFLVYISATIWRVSLLWFWITSIALCFAPFFYNPHQFSLTHFFLDYREYMRWLLRGNITWHKSSWIGFTRNQRTRMTGYKRLTLGEQSETEALDVKRPNFLNLVIFEIGRPLVIVIFVIVPYVFTNSQNDMRGAQPVHIILRLAVCVVGPIAINAVMLLLVFMISCFLGPVISCCCVRAPGIIAAVVHFTGVLVHLSFFGVVCFAENWDFPRGLLGFITSTLLQSLLFKALTVFVLSRELKHDHSTRVWWSGGWISAELGWRLITQPAREYLCKIMECSAFAMDFTLGHFILFAQIPLLLIPYIDRWHTTMLFWLSPGRQIRPPIYSAKQKRLRSRTVQRYALLFILNFLVFLVILIGPFVLYPLVPPEVREAISKFFPGILQPHAPNYGALGMKVEQP